MRWILILLFSTTALVGQDLPDFNEVRDLIMGNLSQIEDYEMDMVMSIDIPGFRMPRREIHYMFKAPDKVKVDVQGFAVVPREGIQPFVSFLSDSLTFDVRDQREYNDQMVYEIGFQDTFQTNEADITLLVDVSTGTIPKGSVVIDGVEMFTTETEYKEVNKGIWLPEYSVVTMNFPPDFKRMQTFGMRPDEFRKLDAEIETNPEWVKGTITLEFKKYKVNRGIPDWKFEEEEEYY
jgi:hypothetical protein